MNKAPNIKEKLLSTNISGIPSTMPKANSLGFRGFFQKFSDKNRKKIPINKFIAITPMIPKFIYISGNQGRLYDVPKSSALR